MAHAGSDDEDGADTGDDVDGRQEVDIVGQDHQGDRGDEVDSRRYPVDYETIVKKAKDKGVLLEINNSSLRPNSFRVGAIENAKVLLNLCKKYETKVIFGSDAHIYYQVGSFENCEKIVKDVDFPGNLIVNYSEEDIKNIFFVKK